MNDLLSISNESNMIIIPKNRGKIEPIIVNNRVFTPIICKTPEDIKIIKITKTSKILWVKRRREKN